MVANYSSILCAVVAGNIAENFAGWSPPLLQFARITVGLCLILQRTTVKGWVALY
ncbi:hypothetical protein U1Q18_051325, partial [Sarracenia purpurea var. burkii]